jgi:hypothetical protein
VRVVRQLNEVEIEDLDHEPEEPVTGHVQSKSLVEHYNIPRHPVTDSLNQMFPISMVPQEMPVIPKYISRLTNEQVMELWREVTAWYFYFSVQAADAEAAERYVEAQADEMQKYVMSNITREKGETVTSMKLKASQDPQIQELNEKYLSAYALRKGLKSRLDAFSHVENFLSRELTRRGMDMTTNRKSDRYAP